MVTRIDILEVLMHCYKHCGRSAALAENSSRGLSSRGAMSFVAARLCSLVIAALFLALDVTPGPAASGGTSVRTLDGEGWLLATDAANVGLDQKWWEAARPEAKRTRVPWIIQDVFPGYHGVAWYWRDFVIAPNLPDNGRVLLRFWAVDYKAEVWVNGAKVGSHEGGESPFAFDITSAAKLSATNRLAVRVLNPTHQRIDGIVLAETPHRNKALPYTAGSAWNQGGIMDSVELLAVPVLHIEDVFVQPDWKTGTLCVRARVVNGSQQQVAGRLEVAVAPAASGETLAVNGSSRKFESGGAIFDAELQVPQHRLWELNDPYLYRVTVRVQADSPAAFDEQSVRCGFRDFRFEGGCFRLNGRRLYLRCSHTGNCSPIGLEIPHDPDLLRRDLHNVKVMGFNAIRFISGVAKRYQLDLCDEIGLLVYEEAYASWCLADSNEMARRYDESVLGMVRRDRNHPSVVIWGLLNETPEGAVFRHAAGALPRVRDLDSTRLVMLNSGAWHESGAATLAGLEVWRTPAGPDPNVTHNPLSAPLVAPWATWAPGRLALHPGPKNEYSVVRWVAPARAVCQVTARFFGPDNKPTTDVHVLHNRHVLFDGWLNLRGAANLASYSGSIPVLERDTVDFVVGVGNGSYGADTTGLEVSIRDSSGRVYDAATQFRAHPASELPWRYGWLPGASKPDPAAFEPYQIGETNRTGSLGILCNPGSTNWEDVLKDQHPYQRVPHTAEIINKLRTMNGGRHPLFISEYGIGSAVDLWRATRHYERLGATHAMDARFYRDKLDRFLADWEAWRMAEVFGRPEDFFIASNRRMAVERLRGLNAIRANTNCVGYSLTGTVDQGMSGEGLFTTFRELKPGTVDAVFDGLAPLRWCLFVEPVHFYRGSQAQLEVVLANEDCLAPGEYPVRLQVFGPANQLIWSRQTNVFIQAASGRAQPLALKLENRNSNRETTSPFAFPVLSEKVVVDGPPGEYRFTATMDHGAAPTGGEVYFHVADRLQLPSPKSEIVLWGEDPVLKTWLVKHGIPHRAFTAEVSRGREVILAGVRPPAPGDADVFRELARRVAGGSTVIFVSPEVFVRGENRVGWVPLRGKVSLNALNAWLYHKDEWARPHAVFEGLPSGLMDYTYYRELIPDLALVGLAAPLEVLVGANDASLAYASGVMLSVHPLMAGRFVLNTLRIRENLNQHPAADRLLSNLLRFTGSTQAEPLAPLPSDFDAQLKAMGY